MPTNESTIAILKPSSIRFVLVATAVIAAVMVWPRSDPTDSNTAEVEVAPGEVEGTDGSVATLTEAQRRGKEIYLTGVSPSGGQLTAVLGNSKTEVPGAVLSCVNCHRHDGRGKPEGGIYPSNIRWDELTKPYVTRVSNTNVRPPYDEPLLRRSITMGLNPEGRELDNSMPRYRMTHRDLGDLVSYLKVLGRERDPGISDAEIRIGVVLGPDQSSGPNAAIRAALLAEASEFNQSGGIYQRQIELRFTESPMREVERAEAVSDFVAKEDLFALVSSFVVGAERDTAQQLAREGIPLIGAQTPFPDRTFPLSRQVFYVASGLPSQGRALVRFADRRNEVSKSAVLLMPDIAVADDAVRKENIERVAEAIESESRVRKHALAKHSVVRSDFDADVVVRDSCAGRPSMLFSLLPAEQTMEVLAAAAKSGWLPDCYLLGNMSGPRLFQIPQAFDRRVFLSFPNLPLLHQTGLREFQQRSEEHGLSNDYLAAQFAAVASLRVMVQGLQLAGAELSRERLVDRIETLSGYRSGYAPPITFGPNRRIGTGGAYVVTMDLVNQKLEPVSEWIDSSVND